jgi:hypothetical protein
MIISRLIGGLGNQMFQYAAGRRLAEMHGTILKLDLTDLLDRTPRENIVFRDYDLDIFDLRVGIATARELQRFAGKYNHNFSKLIYRIKRKLGITPTYISEDLPFRPDPRVLNAPCSCYLDGNWQNEIYFRPIESLIRKEFRFRLKLNDPTESFANVIRSTNSICLNVRRGDFVSNPVTHRHHGVCDVDYFTRAISLIVEKVSDPHFFIFSDDIQWCTTELKLNFPFTIFSNEFAGEKYEYKFFLMTLCKHFIIPNSTYGWWAAWLSENKNKIVISPQKWLNDSSIDTNGLIPPTWIRL